MRFSSDKQRKAFFAGLGNNKFSYDSSCDFSKLNVNPLINDALVTPPKYVFTEKPVEQFSMKSDLEGIKKSLKIVSDNPKFPAELRAKATIESDRVSDILNKQFVDKEDISIEQIPKTEFIVEKNEQTIPTYEEVESHLIKEGINPEDYYAGIHVPRSVYDEGVPSPAQEKLLEQERVREDIREGKVKLDTPILTQVDPVTGEKKISYWDKAKKWVRFAEEADKPIVIKTRLGDMLVKPSVIEDLNKTITRIPKKRGIVEIIESEGGTPKTFDPTK